MDKLSGHLRFLFLHPSFEFGSGRAFPDAFSSFAYGRCGTSSPKKPIQPSTHFLLSLYPFNSDVMIGQRAGSVPLVGEHSEVTPEAASR